jgi:hypothetical protein
MARKSLPTIEELLATLNHSRLPTVVVEGDDDIIVFRHIEESLGFSVLGANGRSSALKIFERRKEIKSNDKIVFLVDRDLWIFSAVPAQYQCKELLTTDGYSIENDLFSDGNLERLLSATERPNYTRDLSTVINWYALAVDRTLNNRDGNLSTHPTRILNDHVFRQAALNLNPGEIYPTVLEQNISADYKRLLRGKTLFGVIMEHLSYAGRSVRHNQHALMEMVASNRGPLLDSLFEKVKAAFD